MERKQIREKYLDDIKTILRVQRMKTLDDATADDMFYAISKLVMVKVTEAWKKTEDNYRLCQLKQVHYLTPEALPGRVYGNNLQNTGMAEAIKTILSEIRISGEKISLDYIEDQEKEPALGNGGLGRLASCFMESLATQGYYACGHTLRYKKGLFQQRIVNGEQVELPDFWCENGVPSGIERKDLKQIVTFCEEGHKKKIEAVPFDMPIVGFPTHGFDDVKVAVLRLWDTANEPEITEYLYPSDKKTEGKLLRLKQQYLLASASVQQIVAQYKVQYRKFDLFTEKIAIHINDTHPAIAIPELMRILMDENGFGWDEAWKMTTKCCSYTNHTIMKEAQEVWPIEMFEKLLPRVYEIIREIHRRAKREFGDNEAMAILYDGQIRMANLAVIASSFVNGVSKVHTEILKNRVFKEFYEAMGEKFLNITNGVAHRQFVFDANPALAEWISEKCRTSKWITDMSCVKKLENIADDVEAQNQLSYIKYRNKENLAREIQKRTGMWVDPSAIFDVQVKRQHEYKRQLMNVLRIRYLYDMLKSDKKFLESFHPMAFIFAGKAHPDYKEAKLIIREIHKLADEVNCDTAIDGKMKVVFLENYNVTLAKTIFPASDVSEQISTASKEASGTGNMKFMMNGAVTLGTLDGANIEIMEAVGKENMFVFGATSEEILEHEDNRDYIASHILLQDERMKRAVNALCPELRNSLIYNQSPMIDADRYFVLLDLKDYIRATLELNETYKDPRNWWHMIIMNIANSGYFSVDRTIQEYAKKVWGCESIYED